MTRKYKFNSTTRKNEHTLIAEKAIGRPLKGSELVHHADGNRLNNANDNLVLCPDQAYHMLIHKRMEALEACGNPWHRKCMYCKGWDSTDNLAKRNKSRNSTSWSYMHRICDKEYQWNLRRR